jgi:hypothetical protein
MDANRNNHPRSPTGSDGSLGQILRFLRTDSDGLMSHDWMEQDSRSGEQGWPIMLSKHDRGGIRALSESGTTCHSHTVSPPARPSPPRPVVPGVLGGFLLRTGAGGGVRAERSPPPRASMAANLAGLRPPMQYGSMLMQSPRTDVAGLGTSRGQGKGCMRLPPDVGTVAGTSRAVPISPAAPVSSRENWLLQLTPARLAEITRQHGLMHEPAVAQGNAVGREMERRRQSQRLINLLAQRNLLSNNERARRSGVTLDGSAPLNSQFWNICCILDALEGGAWAEQPNWHLLVLWKEGDTTWEECGKLQRDIGQSAILQHLSDVERMRSHYEHDSRSMMGYDHPWMPKELCNDKHNYGHDPLFYSRAANS